jgi:hypothetical protein
MPATSTSQQRLMAQAYAIKTGKMKPADLNPEYKDQIVDLAKNMTEKQLKDYAETSHKGLPKRVGEDLIPTFESFINEAAPIEIVSMTRVMDNRGRTETTTKRDYILTYFDDGDYDDDTTFKDKVGNVYFIDDLIDKAVKIGNKTITVVEERVNEGKWANIMKGVKSGNPNGPWTIVIIDKMTKKVVHQDVVEVRDAIPAHYEEMKKKYPNANISIEDKQGTQVFKESVENLKENTAAATVSSVNGMGAPMFPGNPTSQDSFVDQEPGSGDIPFQLSKGKPKKKKKSSFRKFDDFVKGSQELRSAF